VTDLLAGGRVFVFWIKTECPTCQRNVRYVERMATRLPDDRVIIVTQNEPDAVEEFRAAHECPTVPIFCEPEPYTDADAFGLTHVPTWFVFERSETGDHLLSSGMAFATEEMQEVFESLGGEGALFTEDELASLPPRQPG